MAGRGCPWPQHLRTRRQVRDTHTAHTAHNGICSVYLQNKWLSDDKWPGQKKLKISIILKNTTLLTRIGFTFKLPLRLRHVETSAFRFRSQFIQISKWMCVCYLFFFFNVRITYRHVPARGSELWFAVDYKQQQTQEQVVEAFLHSMSQRMWVYKCRHNSISYTCCVKPPYYKIRIL